MLRLIMVTGITIAGTLVAVPEVLAQRLVPRVTINDVSIIEGSAPTRTRVEFDVTLTVASDRSVSIDYATADGTATATGDRESADYVETSGTLTVPAGSTSQKVFVSILVDDRVEPNETFVVNLTDARNAVLRDAQGVGTIIDDDGPDSPRGPELAIGDVSVREGDGPAVDAETASATFEVTLSAPVAHPVTVDYFTADGTATALSNTAAIEIPATGEEGLASRYPSTISVPATRGVLTDVNVTLTGLTHPVEDDLDVLLEGPDGTTVVLLSDWSYPRCSFADADLTFDDSWPPLRDSCQSGNYAPTNHGRGGDTFPFPAPEGTPGTALSWFNGTNPTGNWNLYIVDDDDYPRSGDVGELSGWSLTLTTSGEGDYGATSGTLTFSAGTTRQTVAVDITPDVAIEPTETFRLNLLSASSNALIGDAWAVGRIFDDDETDNEPNSAPLTVGTLPRRRLRVNEAAVVGLAAAFRDPDDDLLAYRASSSAIGVASVNVSEGLLTMNPMADGTATITVTATDVGGSNRSAAQQFAVTVGEGSGPEWLDDYRDTWRVLGGAPDGGAASVPRGRVENGAFTDDRIRPGTTPLKVVHFHELRARIAALRAREGLPAVQWTDPTLVAGVTPVKRVHLMELRTALDVVYDAVGRPRLSYTDAAVVAGTTAIRAVHLMELRTGVAALE